MTTESLADATEPGPPDSYPSTPGEFAARWNAWSEERRAEWLAAAVENAETALHCRVRHGAPISRFATGGYVGAGTAPALSRIDPDECLLRAKGVRAGQFVCSRPGHPTATSGCAPIADLRALCRAHGIADEDSAPAIATYTARGRLTEHDRARLADMSEDERSTALAARYGSDAARVAQIDYSQANS